MQEYCIKTSSNIWFGHLLELPHRGNSNKYPKHMFYEEIRIKQGLSYISFWPLRIPYNSKFILMATSLETIAVVVTRVWGWSGGAKVLCILDHRGVQLILAYSWARPAILVVGKGRGGMFLFLLFLHFNSCSSFFPVPLFHLLYSLFYLFSPLGDDTKWPSRVDVSLNPNTINVTRVHCTICDIPFRPPSVAQLDAPSDWRPGGRGFNPRRCRQHSFIEIDHEIFSTVLLFLPLIQEGQLSVSGERMCTILVNRLED